MTRRPPSPPLFPYTTLFRSNDTATTEIGTSCRKECRSRWSPYHLPPCPACAVPPAAAATARATATEIFFTVFIVDCLRMLRPSCRVAGRLFLVLAEEELTAHVDVQDEQVVLVRRQQPPVRG